MSAKTKAILGADPELKDLIQKLRDHGNSDLANIFELMLDEIKLLSRGNDNARSTEKMD